MSCIGDCNNTYIGDITAAWQNFQLKLQEVGDDEQKRKDAIEEWETQRQAIYNTWLSCMEGCSEA